MTIKKIKIDEVKLNPNNPRTIKDDKFKKLVKSIKNFPQMLDIRPIVVDENNIVLGGNMRLKACKEAGLKEVSIIKASELTEKQKKEFIVKDNAGYGEWDNAQLGDWDKELLIDGGFESWELNSIFGINDSDYEDRINKSNFEPDEIDVNDYIKQNILFFNEMMIEFEDDEIKECIRNIKDISTKENFIDDIKKLILQYGKNSI